MRIVMTVDQPIIFAVDDADHGQRAAIDIDSSAGDISPI
jgi:hypothetical protein